MRDYDLERKIQSIENKKSPQYKKLLYLPSDNLSDDTGVFVVKFKQVTDGGAYFTVNTTGSGTAAIYLDGVRVDKFTAEGDSRYDFSLTLQGGEKSLKIQFGGLTIKSVAVFGEVEETPYESQTTYLTCGENKVVCFYDGRKHRLTLYTLSGKTLTEIHSIASVDCGSISRASSNPDEVNVYYIISGNLKCKTLNLQTGNFGEEVIVSSGVSSVSGTFIEGYAAAYFVKNKTLYLLKGLKDTLFYTEKAVKNLYKVIASPNVEGKFIGVNYDKTAVLYVS